MLQEVALLTRNSTQNIRLGIGTNGSVLKSDGTDVSWGLWSSWQYLLCCKTRCDNDDSDSGRGTSVEKTWLTLVH